MASKTTPATEIEFGTWEEPEKVNPYATIASAFVKAYKDGNEKVSYTLKVPAEKATTERNKFSSAVNDEGMTARLRDTKNVGEETHMLFTLTKRHKARRTSKSA